jgi:hypothetical protein
LLGPPPQPTLASSPISTTNIRRCRIRLLSLGQ